MNLCFQIYKYSDEVISPSQLATGEVVIDGVIRRFEITRNSAPLLRVCFRLLIAAER